MIAAGPHQRLDEPFGDGIEGLHDWMIAAMRDRADGIDGYQVTDLVSSATVTHAYLTRR